MKNKKFLLLFLCLFTISIFTTACGGGGKSTSPSYPFIPIPTPTPTPAKYPLELSQTQFTLNIGTTDNITVMLNGENITETATYTVDQESIATVEKGLITGLSVGIAKVTVHADEAEADKTFTVNVIDPSLPPLELSQTQFTLNIGTTDNITVMLNGEDITETATYTVDQEAIASVEGGLITGISVGIAKVTVHSDEAEADKTFTVNVIDPTLPTLELSKEEFTLNVGATDNITVILNGEDITETAVYTVDQEAIATVEGGLITGISVGIAKVTVHSDEAEADKTFTVNVIDPTLPTLEVEPTNFVLLIDETDNVTVTLEGKDVTEQVEYNVEQESIATVEKGLITGLSLGQTDVTVSLEGANNAIFTVIVTNIETVELNDDVLDQLYKLGKIDKDSAHKTELTEINIPATYKLDGKIYKITSIGEKIFKDCVNLTKVTIPNSIKTINDGAFYGTSIEEIIIPDSVTTLGYAVHHCYLLKTITIGDGVTDIKSGLCENLKSLETVTIGKNVESIGTAVFKDCEKLAKIAIPDGVKTIGDSIFSGTSIKKIEIPDSITIIGYPFSGCTTLEEITIGNGIKELKSGQFSSLTSLKKVTIGDGLTTIGSDTFSSLSNLETVIIGKNLKTIGDLAFKNCTGLKNINFPNGLESIGNSAFFKCDKLENISLPNTLESIGNEAFKGCGNSEKGTGLKKVEIPGCIKEEAITVIGERAFQDCFYLNELTLGNGVKTIKKEAFVGCGSSLLDDVVQELIIPDSVTEIGKYAFKNCCFFKKLIIGTGITNISEEAFSSCANLTELEFKEGTNINEIETLAFSNCAALVCVIPDQVDTIGIDAFYQVKHITYNTYNGSATGFPWGAKQEDI